MSLKCNIYIKISLYCAFHCAFAAVGSESMNTASWQTFRWIETSRVWSCLERSDLKRALKWNSKQLIQIQKSVQRTSVWWSVCKWRHGYRHCCIWLSEISMFSAQKRQYLLLDNSWKCLPSRIFF